MVCQGVVGVAGDEKNARVRNAFHDFREKFLAARFRHDDVRDHQVELRRGQELERSEAASETGVLGERTVESTTFFRRTT